MATLPTIVNTPSQAARAYADVDAGAATAADAAGDAASSFGATLSRALGDVVDTGHAADTRSMQAIAGHGNVTDVVTAVSKAELALQTTTAIRDRMVQAYQDIMKMPI
jgi:flagellar hook-basal body complex protein FliE